MYNQHGKNEKAGLGKRLYKSAHIRIRRILSSISPILLSKLLFRIMVGRPLNLNNPVSFNEKIMWLKFNDYHNNELIRQCVDKYRVREYIKTCGCGEILNDLIGVYQKPDEIDWDVLPEKFVMKCNHGSGYNILCEDKAHLDWGEAERVLTSWLQEDYWRNYAEINYMNIEKTIIAEKYLESKEGKELVDYKFYCVDGAPQFLYIRRKKLNSEATERVFMDLQWQFIDIGSEVSESNGLPERPSSFDQMIRYAEKLAAPFPFVRVDFYDLDGHVVFGELTFTPLAGLDPMHELTFFDDCINLETINVGT